MVHLSFKIQMSQRRFAWYAVTSDWRVNFFTREDVFKNESCLRNKFQLQIVVAYKVINFWFHIFQIISLILLYCSTIQFQMKLEMKLFFVKSKETCWGVIPFDKSCTCTVWKLRNIMCIQIFRRTFRESNNFRVQIKFTNYFKGE